jgi:YVTN family beta-propeller protein
MRRRSLMTSIGLLGCALCLWSYAFPAGQDPKPVAEVDSASEAPLVLPPTPAVIGSIIPPNPCSATYALGVAYDSIHQTMWVAITPPTGPGFVCEFGLTPPYPLIAFVPNVINPYALAFDATTGYIWATNVYSAPGVFVNTVTVIDTAGAGAIVNVLPTGTHPAGDCFFKSATTDVYVMDFGPVGGPWDFTGILDNVPWTTTTTRALGNNPHSCVAVGKDLWLTLEFSNQVERVAPPAPGVTYPVGVQPWGITYDGTSVWVANQISNTVEALDPATGAARATLSVTPTGGSNPFDLATGTVAGVNYVWAVDEVSGNLTQIQTKKVAGWGAVTGTSTPFGNLPQFDAFDPINNHIWVTSTNNGLIFVLN